MQRNLRHIWGTWCITVLSPSNIGGTCPPCPPRDLRHCRGGRLGDTNRLRWLRRMNAWCTEMLQKYPNLFLIFPTTVVSETPNALVLHYAYLLTISSRQ